MASVFSMIDHVERNKKVRRELFSIFFFNSFVQLFYGNVMSNVASEVSESPHQVTLQSLPP